METIIPGDFFMPRLARIYTDDGVFHVLTRGNNKQWIFHNETDFKKYQLLVQDLMPAGEKR